ncbi:BTB/POZ domain protein Btb2 [Sugiyamaella lignohabitans]|uniref:BTB/POZ domain protein Btb2 n=1 Tax=Sugiyamaella lignohabitans TaxID=796027 RepID=A0A161HL11_9ASCO|nr:BTB/POZ domain protein Btb2 [Sugiyamaella lignohabitans]ANB12628.1 BTB/POZ domain protein Btb2 [Sugiyamaella lignohabitans]
MNQPPPGFSQTVPPHHPHAPPPPPPPPHGLPHPGHAHAQGHGHPGHPGHPVPLHLPPPIPPMPQNGFINGTAAGNGSANNGTGIVPGPVPVSVIPNGSQSNSKGRYSPAPNATAGGSSRSSGVTSPVPAPISAPALVPTPPIPAPVPAAAPGPAPSAAPVLTGTNATNSGTVSAAKGSTNNEFDLASYVYNAGFVHAAWADTFLNITPHPPLRLHALFASRSPLLYSILANYASGSPPYHINLASDDKYLTSGALSLAAATLYGHALDSQSCDLELAKGLLSAGNLLALDDISSGGYQAILNLLSIDTVEEILEFALSSAGSRSNDEQSSAGTQTGSARGSPDLSSSSASNNGNPRSGSTSASTDTTNNSASSGSGSAGSTTSNTSNGTSLSGSSSNRSTPAYEDLQITYPGPYPRFTSNLVATVVDFLLNNFKNAEFQTKLRTILLTLPFHIYKHIIESDRLAVKSHMERHSFAREMTNAREQHRRKNSASRPVVYEENVVLAFGGGKGGVEVIRKPLGKKKTLWKASQ